MLLQIPAACPLLPAAACCSCVLLRAAVLPQSQLSSWKKVHMMAVIIERRPFAITAANFFVFSAVPLVVRALKPKSPKEDELGD